MSDENKQTEGTPPSDTAQLKAEFNRKIDSLAATLAQTTNDLKAALAAKPAAQQTQTKKSFKDAFYDDGEDAAAQILKNEVKQEMRLEMAQSNRQAEVMNRLVQDFPELADHSNPLTQKAVEIYKTLPEDEKNVPGAYRLAVLDAAADLGIQPARKRSNTDDWTSGGGGSQRTSKQREADVSQATLDFAEIMGLDLSNDKVKKSLTERAARKNWGTYKKP